MEMTRILFGTSQSPGGKMWQGWQFQKPKKGESYYIFFDGTKYIYHSSMGLSIANWQDIVVEEFYRRPIKYLFEASEFEDWTNKK
jgi:hypothetical protein